jgi:acetyltransferase-like isoleucine patch superfamily enzyme
MKVRSFYRFQRAAEQIEFLFTEIDALVNKRHWRYLTIWFGGSVYVNISYRLDRMLFLLVGRTYPVIRPIFFPLFLICQLLGGRHEIHYRAQIGRGLRILHSALGTVVSGQAIIGDRLNLTGGNCIGGRPGMSLGDLVVGCEVTLGANAVILGPIRIGDRCILGAGAVAVSDAGEGSVLLGVPAEQKKRND